MPLKFFPKRKKVDEDEVRRRAEAAAQEAGVMEEEEGLEEGDVTDYISPVSGLSRKGLRKVISSIKAQGAPTRSIDYSKFKKAIDKARDASEEAANTIRYKGWNKDPDFVENLSSEEFFRRAALREARAKRRGK